MEFKEHQEMKRPTLLLVLSILSFISIGFGFFGGIFSFLSGPVSVEDIDALIAENMPMIEQLRDLGSDYWANEMMKSFQMIRYTNANFWMNQAVNLLAYGVGFVGVFFMLKGFKKGFHAYIIYNLLLLLSPFASVPFGEVPSFLLISNAIIAGIFIFLYSRNLTYLNK